jgi:hypothetical protein
MILRDGAVEGLSVLSRYYTAVDIVPAKSVYSDATGEHLYQYKSGAHRVILVEFIRENSRHWYVGMVLDELHCCDFVSKSGTANKGGCVSLNMNSGCPASFIGEFEWTDDVIKPVSNLV